MALKFIQEESSWNRSKNYLVRIKATSHQSIFSTKLSKVLQLNSQLRHNHKIRQMISKHKSKNQISFITGCRRLII